MPAMGRIRPHHAIHNGKATHFPGSSYYLRYPLAGRRIWEPAGNDPSLAVINLQRKVHELQAVALGIAPKPTPATVQPATPAVEAGDAQKRLLVDCTAAYIAETKEHKSYKTLAAYRCTLESFVSIVKKKHLEDLTRDDILVWIAALRKKGNAPRTIRNRIDLFQIFLHYAKLPSLLTGNDLPKYTDKKVRAYNPVELGKMFDHATPDESDLLHFLLSAPALGNRTLSMFAGRMWIWSGRHIRSPSISI
jgi:integrase/recombinase XerD